MKELEQRSNMSISNTIHNHVVSEKELNDLRRLRITESEMYRLLNSPSLSIYTNIEWREPKRVYSPSSTIFHLVQLKQNDSGEFDVYVGGLPLNVYIKIQNRFSVESMKLKSIDSQKHPTIILYHSLKDIDIIGRIVDSINENEHFIVTYYSASQDDAAASEFPNLRTIKVRVTDNQLSSLPTYCTILQEIVADKCYMATFTDKSIFYPYDAVYVHGFPVVAIGVAMYQYKTLNQLENILLKYGAYEVVTESKYHDWLKISFKCKRINLEEFYHSLREAGIKSRVFANSKSFSFKCQKREDYHVRLTYVGPEQDNENEESIMSAIRNGHGEAYGLD